MNVPFHRRKYPVRSIGTVAIVLALFFLVALGKESAAEKPKPAKPANSATERQTNDLPPVTDSFHVDCHMCHKCSNPTKENPCLQMCPRIVAEAIIAKKFAAKHGPDVVILSALEGRFLPVPFDHEGHADMADMTGGCAVCHHFTPEGEKHPACKTCHEVAPMREDIRKPGLKGAYHRQCMGCHREWSGDTRCVLCHAPKTGVGQEAMPTKDDLVGQMHPPIPEPDTEIYESTSASAPGKHVIFRHKEHVHRFGLKCVDCHREDNCSRCHEEGKKHTQRVRTLEEHHQPCADCHDADSEDLCDRCHWEEGKPKPPPFDHADTGWPLNRFHEGRSCRVCHKNVPFAKLSRDCDACHSGWSPETFDHAITGQTLSEDHAEVDCEDCHADRNFTTAPSCDECHDEDEGIAFPAKRPGPFMEPAVPKK